MTTLKDAGFAKDQEQVLDSVMQGGSNWAQHIAEGGSCLESCPAYAQCHGSGPQKVCSSQWRDAEANPNVLDVVFHVSNNFDYYNCGDISITGSDSVLAEVRRVLHELRSQLDDEHFEEGSQSHGVHRYRERNSKAARQKKNEALSGGHLSCEACGVDYLALYGIKGLRLMECHHTVPLSSDAHDGKTRKGDLLLLCANCHRLAHSVQDPVPLPELQSLVGYRKS